MFFLKLFGAWGIVVILFTWGWKKLMDNNEETSPPAGSRPPRDRDDQDLLG